ncbi:hypothetical protein B7463_g11302, partial [Scytalidium lignicola]
MERHRRSRRKKRAGKSCTSDYRSHNHLQHSWINESLGGEANDRVEYIRPESLGYTKTVPAHTLSEDTDYITKWLLQVAEQTCPSVDIIRPQYHHETFFDYTFLNDPALINFDHTNARILPARDDYVGAVKKRNNTTSDSSLLEEEFASRSRVLLRHNLAAETRNRQENVVIIPGNRREDDLSGTREDRYQPKSKRSKAEHTQSNGPKKTRKKSSRLKPSQMDANDLMHNFSSGNIGSERLTIRRDHGPGLFNNGRAFTSMRRRGLPDLAFSEMKFLQNDNESISQAETKQRMSTSKNKERRRRESSQNEISTYFRPTEAMVPRSYTIERARSSSTTRNNQRHLDIGQACGKQIKSYHKISLLPSVEVSRTQDRRFTLSNISCIFSPSPIPDSRPVAETPQNHSRDTTWISWSETQCSPRRTKTVLQQENPRFCRTVSPTPIVVQKPNEKAGISVDGGIESRENPTRPKAGSQSAIFIPESYKFHEASPNKPSFYDTDPVIQSKSTRVPHHHTELTTNEKDSYRRHRGSNSKSVPEQESHNYQDRASTGYARPLDAKEISAEVPNRVQIAQELRINPPNRISQDIQEHGVSNEARSQGSDQNTASGSNIAPPISPTLVVSNSAVQTNKKVQSLVTAQFQGDTGALQNDDVQINQLGITSAIIGNPTHLHMNPNKTIQIDNESSECLCQRQEDMVNEYSIPMTSQHITSDQVSVECLDKSQHVFIPRRSWIPQAHSTGPPIHQPPLYETEPYYYDHAHWPYGPCETEYRQDQLGGDDLQGLEPADVHPYESTESIEYGLMQELCRVDQSRQEYGQDPHYSSNQGDFVGIGHLRQDEPSAYPYQIDEEELFIADHPQQQDQYSLRNPYFPEEFSGAYHDLDFMQTPLFNQSSCSGSSGHRFWQPYLQY